MAHKKGVGSTDNGRDSNSKRLGVKLFGGEYAKAGNIIVRQRGTKFHPGENVYMGRDHTLHAKIEGHVGFTKRRNKRTFVHIDPIEGGSQVKPKAKKAAAPAKEAPKAASAKEAPKAAAPAAAASAGKPDDLTKVEGIGPAIAKVLAGAGIITYSDLAAKSADDIKSILTDAGGRFASHTPTTWPMQAGMAANGEWDKLEKWQDESDGGKPIAASSEEE